MCKDDAKECKRKRRINDLGWHTPTKEQPTRIRKQDISNVKVLLTLQTQVSTKQDTYFLKIKEDLSNFIVSRRKEKHLTN